MSKDRNEDWTPEDEGQDQPWEIPESPSESEGLEEEHSTNFEAFRTDFLDSVEREQLKASEIQEPSAGAEPEPPVELESSTPIPEEPPEEPAPVEPDPALLEASSESMEIREPEDFSDDALGLEIGASSDISDDALGLEIGASGEVRDDDRGLEFGESSEFSGDDRAVEIEALGKSEAGLVFGEPEPPRTDPKPPISAPPAPTPTPTPTPKPSRNPLLVAGLAAALLAALAIPAAIYYLGQQPENELSGDAVQRLAAAEQAADAERAQREQAEAAKARADQQLLAFQNQLSEAQQAAEAARAAIEAEQQRTAKAEKLAADERARREEAEQRVQAVIRGEVDLATEQSIISQFRERISTLPEEQRPEMTVQLIELGLNTVLKQSEDPEQQDETESLIESLIKDATEARALAADSNDSAVELEILYLQGLLLEVGQRFDEAREVYQEGLSMAPDRAQVIRFRNASGRSQDRARDARTGPAADRSQGRREPILGFVRLIQLVSLSVLPPSSRPIRPVAWQDEEDERSREQIEQEIAEINDDLDNSEISRDFRPSLLEQKGSKLLQLGRILENEEDLGTALAYYRQAEQAFNEGLRVLDSLSLRPYEDRQTRRDLNRGRAVADRLIEQIIELVPDTPSDPEAVPRLEADLKQVRGELSKAQAELKRLNEDLTTTKDQINKALARVQTLEATEKRLTTELAQVRLRLNSMQEQLGQYQAAGNRWSQFTRRLAQIVGFSQPQPNAPLPGEPDGWAGWFNDLGDQLQKLADQGPASPAPPPRPRIGDAYRAYDIGLNRFYQNDYPGAIEHFSRAIDWHSEDARFYYFRGLSRYLESGRYPSNESLADLRQGYALERQGLPNSREVGKALHRVQYSDRNWLDSQRRPSPTLADDSPIAFNIALVP